MSKPNYRVTLNYDADRKVFMARAPELEHCTGEGASRAEAIARVEEEIDAQLANMLSHGSTPPRSVDEEEFSGELAVKVSRILHRDLAYQARSEGIDLDHLLGELLAASMENRKQSHRGQPRGHQRPDAPDGIGNRHDGGRGEGPRRGGFGRNNYQAQNLDDRANFIEYVRNLEQNGNGAGRHPGGGGGGAAGADNRRRRRRGGSGGGNPNHRHDGPRMQGNGHPGNGHGGNGGRPQNMGPGPNGNGAGHAPSAHPGAHADAPPPVQATPPTPHGEPDGNA